MRNARCSASAREAADRLLRSGPGAWPRGSPETADYRRAATSASAGTFAGGSAYGMRRFSPRRVGGASKGRGPCAPRRRSGLPARASPLPDPEGRPSSDEDLARNRQPSHPRNDCPGPEARPCSKDREAADDYRAVASPVRSRVDLSIVGNGELRYFPAGLACEAVERPEDASGEYLLFLEPGAAPARGSIEELVRTADADPRIGAVGPRLVGPDGKLVEAGGIVFADGSLASYGAGDQPRDPRYRFVRDVDFVSPSCVVVRASAFPGLDGELDDPRYRFADLCLALRAAGHRVVCQPAAEATVDPHAEGPAPLTRARLERLRPIVLGPRPSDAEPHRVLVLGIAMADRQNTAEDVIASMESDRHEVVQRWIALGDEPDTPLLTAATAEIVRERVPKYELLHRLLAREPLGTYDHVVITDDDVVLPRRFLDSFLAFQDRFGFALAQPARTSTSYIDHPIVEQQLGTLARETRF